METSALKDLFRKTTAGTGQKAQRVTLLVSRRLLVGKRKPEPLNPLSIPSSSHRDQTQKKGNDPVVRATRSGLSFDLEVVPLTPAGTDKEETGEGGSHLKSGSGSRCLGHRSTSRQYLSSAPSELSLLPAGITRVHLFHFF